MKTLYIGLSLACFILISCVNKNESPKKAENVKNKKLVYLSLSDIPKGITRQLFEGKKFDYVFRAGEGVYLCMLFMNGASDYYCFINPKDNDTTNILTLILTEFNYYHCELEYDSAYYDLEYYTNAERNKDHNQNGFSWQLKNIHLLRQKNRKSNSIFIELEKNIAENMDIKRLEAVLNEMSYFNDFSFKNKNQLNTLLNILMFTQISLLNSMLYYPDSETRLALLNNSFVHVIKSKKDYDEFCKFIKTTNSTNGYKRIDEYWSKANYAFLFKQLKNIENEFQQENIFYFYTYRDYKLFRFEVNYKNGKFQIDKKYINRDYYWYNVLDGLPDFRNYLF